MFYDPELTPFEPRQNTGPMANARNYIEGWPVSVYREGFVVKPRQWGLAPEQIFLTDPQLIEDVLLTRAELFRRDRISTEALSARVNRDSLFFAEGAGWRWQRRAAASAFRHENLLALVPTFAECAQAQAQAWRDAPSGEAIDVSLAMSRTTFAIIERVVLGEATTLDRDRFLAALVSALGSVRWRFVIALLRLPGFTPFPGFLRANAAERYLYEETVKAVEARRACPTERRDILGLLLSARDPETGRVMTDAELVSNLYTFMIAGHETSAVALAWTLWLVAKDQATQTRLRAEVGAVAGDRAIGPEEVEKLAFARQTICESMRLFPPGAAIGREPKEDVRLGPHVVRKGAPVYVAVWALHRHEKLWDEPAAFDPDRFVPEKAKSRHRCAYLPFGAGPRVCIGQSFAMLEMIAVLATLVRSFRFATVPGHRVELMPSVTVRPKGGLPLLIERV